MKGWILTTAIAALFLASCNKEDRECPGSTEKTFTATAFNKVKASDGFYVNIVKGNEFSVKAKGCANDLEDINVSVINGNIVDIRYRNHKNDRYRVDFTVTMPLAYSIILEGAAKGTVTGFTGDDYTTKIALSGASELTMNDNTAYTQFDISGASKLLLKGSTETLKGVASGASILNAFDAPADDIDIAVSGASKANIYATRVLTVDASGASQVIYRGNPTQKDFSTSGGGKITKE
ncbi:MAG: head GIN domain-containing protein [Chitinophagaceae bacterium]